MILFRASSAIPVHKRPPFVAHGDTPNATKFAGDSNMTLRFLNILADIGLRPYHILRRSIRSIDLIRYNSLQARFTALHLSLRHLHSMLDVSLPATVPFPRHQSDGTGRDLYMACLERCVPLILDSQSLFIKR